MNKWARNYSELQSLPSYCQPRQKIIVSEENRVQHRGINNDESRVRQIKVDGDMWTKGIGTIRADYLLLNEDKKTSYIIELKGSDIEHALEQIKNTDTNLSEALSGFEKFWRLVYRTSTKKMKNRDENALQRKYPNLVIRKNTLEENI